MPYCLRADDERYYERKCIATLKVNMSRDRIILAFQDDLGHRLMSELVDRGFLWCSGTLANIENAETIWATPEEEPMTLTVLGKPLAQSAEQLDDLFWTSLEHHPQISSVEVLGFDDMSQATRIAGQHGFRLATTGPTYVYVREA